MRDTYLSRQGKKVVVASSWAKQSKQPVDNPAAKTAKKGN